MVTKVISELKSISRLKIFRETGPTYSQVTPIKTYCVYGISVCNAVTTYHFH